MLRAPPETAPPGGIGETPQAVDPPCVMMGIMATLGFLHTAAAHVATFDALVGSVGTASALHRVEPDLLTRTRAGVPDPGLSADVRTALESLAAEGADVVVCTCSTLGEIAERATTPVPVLRIDRPMASAAVRAGPRLGVVAALSSTLAPTARLLREEARAAGVAVGITESCLPQAWATFECGDHAGYLAQISAAARDLAWSTDVVVLAQASMAGALELLEDLSVPVLASPRPAVDAALGLVASGTPAPASPTDPGRSVP